MADATFTQASSDAVVEKRKAALAASLMQFHPELRTAITSDRGAAEIVDRINDLVEAHCLKLLMTITRNQPPSLGEFDAQG